jgi:hypothetical protein
LSVRSCHSLDRIAVSFDDDNAVANAGLILPATAAQHLGIETLVNEAVDLGDRPGASRPGRKVMTLIWSILAGGDCIDDADALRSGSTERILPHRVMAPSTLGTFLRSFTFGHVRQLDKVAEVSLARAWAAGAGPGGAELTIDLDSTICEVHGYKKGGAAFGYTKVRGYHPILATRADSGEVLHLRQRKGSANTARGAARFLSETLTRARRAGAAGKITVRADSGFWSKKLISACRAGGVDYSITVRGTDPVREAIASIDEAAWEAIDCTEAGEAQVAETVYGDDRLIVRRTRLTGPQAELFPDWRHHAFVTNREGSAVDLDADHRRHAVCELAIRDLKEGSGWNHCPSGNFFANAAWLVIAALAHNLCYWTVAIGLGRTAPVPAKTLRRRYLALPGRLTRQARRKTLRLPRQWPWGAEFYSALVRLRGVRILT